MAIALPPPIPPQAAAVSELRVQAKTQPQIVVDHLGFHIRIFGSTDVAPALLKQAIQRSSNMSDAVRVITSLYYASGHPATVVHYAWAGASSRDVFVLVTSGKIEQVIAPEALQSYFENLKGDAALNEVALERDRALAGIHSDRAGEDYKPVFKFRSESASGNGVDLDLGQPQPGPSKTSLLGSFNNYGNRYAGPQLASAGLRRSFENGSEAVISGTATGETDRGSYYGGSVKGSQVTRYGVFELELGRADFVQSPEGYRFDGKLISAKADWLTPLYFDFRQHLNLRLRVQYDGFAVDGEATDEQVGIDRTLDILLRQLGLLPEADSSSDQVLSERYVSAELALNYLRRLNIAGHRAELQGGFVARKGLGSTDSSPMTSADLHYWLLEPSVNLRYTLTQNWTLLGDADLQISDGVLPQQQQYVIGGPDKASAYEPGAAIGDRGLSLRVGTEWKGEDASWTERYRIRPRLYLEYGKARLHEIGDSASQRTELADVVARVDLQFNSWLSGSLSLSQPIRAFDEERRPDSATENRFFFQLTGRY